MAAGKHGKLLEPGSRAPDFRLPQLDGGAVALREILANGPAVIAFFKTTCPVCQLTLPFLERIHKAGTLPVYAVSLVIEGWSKRDIGSLGELAGAPVFRQGENVPEWKAG